MNKYIEEAQQLKLELDKLRPISIEQELAIMQKFRLDWNYHSNNLEGNQLTYGETRALLLFNITAQSKPLKDHLEVTGHNEAIKLVEEIVKEERPLTESFIRELHRLLLKEPYEKDAITPDGQPTKKFIKVGEYKSVPNHVKTVTGEIFRFATPEETPAKMSDLIEWYRKEVENEESNPIAIASLFHYKFIRIHPFDDGNGRTARLLMNFILMRYGYPPVIIKTEDKENYFAVLRQADAGIIEPFIEYIAQNLLASLDILIKGAKGESIEEPDDIDKELALFTKELYSAGRPLTILRTYESITDVFKDVFTRIFDSLNNKSKSLQKFYKEIQYSIYIDRIGKHSKDIYDTFDKGYSSLSDIKIPREIKGEIHFNSFVHPAYQEFSNSYSIEIRFSESRYYITKDGNPVYSKLYGEDVSEEEIKQIVDSVLRSHINKIQRMKMID